MNDERQKIVERVKKLLALSASSNEHEAALAAEKAQELLAAHNLSMSEVETKDSEGGQITETGTDYQHPKVWERPLRHAVARLYFCTYYCAQGTFSGKRQERHFTVGEPHNITVAVLMADYLVKTVDRLAWTECKIVAKDEQKRFRVSFRNACAMRLVIRLEKKRKAMMEAPTKTTTGTTLPALMSLYEKANQLTTSFMNNKEGMKTSRNTLKMGHLLGALTGNRAGDQISLDAQVGTESNRSKLTRQ